MKGDVVVRFQAEGPYADEDEFYEEIARWLEARLVIDGDVRISNMAVYRSPHNAVTDPEYFEGGDDED